MAATTTIVSSGKAKTLVLRPMTPSQVLADRVHPPKPHGNKSEREIHHKGSESHKPNMSDPMRTTTNGLVLLATKRELNEVWKHPSHTLHFVLLYKDEVISPNDSPPLPPIIATILQEFADVFPDELPPSLPPLRGIEHRIDLIPGAPLPNRAPYCTNPEENKEIQRQVQQLLDKGYVRESLSPCA